MADVLQDRPYPVRAVGRRGETLIERLGCTVGELDADARDEGQYRSSDLPREFAFRLSPASGAVVTRCRLIFRGRSYLVRSYRDDGHVRRATAVASERE